MSKKVAITHHHFINMRGGEKVVVELKKIFPQADVYSLMYNKKSMPKFFEDWNIKTTFLNKLPFFYKYYQNLLPLYPFAIESIDLTSYDLVISTDSFVTKGIITSPEATHICYCFTPMRFIWDQYHEYLKNFSPLKKFFFKLITNYLRMWDYNAAGRVDYFLANSNFVAKRINKYYRRECIVINSPVDCSRFHITDKTKDYFLFLSALVPYKKADLAIKACNKLKVPLIIAGNGTALPELRKIAGKNITFLENVSDKDAAQLFSECKALLFPGLEDFGIVPLEAMASGRPVIAYQKGGALDTVKEGLNGIFFKEQTVDSLCNAIERFNKQKFDSQLIREYSKNFDNPIFRKNIKETIDRLINC